MSTQVQYRRGTNTQNDAFTGVLAEITVDTTNGTLRVHDGLTAGGSALISAGATQTLTNKTLTSPAITTATFTGTQTGSANLNLTGAITASGNITGSYLFGNGSQLTGIDATSIQNGTANARTFLNGNVTISAAGVANVVVVTSTGANIAGTLNTGTGNANVGNLGATTVVATTLTGTLSTAAQTNITSVGTLGSLSVTGNISGGNLNVTGDIVDTGALSIITGSNGNLTLNAGSGSIVISSGILNGQANGVGNIGSATTYFNTVFAKATSAQYADVAERYQADADYQIGTVLVFDGTKEVTQSTRGHLGSIAGTVSENPAYIMNSGLEGDHVVTIALLGRVPCRVVGRIARGACLVSSDIPGVATQLDDNSYRHGCVIGKALQSYDSDEPGVIEIVVGRL